jgi:eukaryotic-like serine/threonine-protein kinase
MSSIIKGYNYDIFISYRQKDNKGDRWVSEFVEALKTELESTFKEEISVYFDINPHDGLLETHDVDASLKDKLKCLIFIPIISRTYCDPKSFAWEHEFKAFVEQTLKDQFGIKVKLPNGNVANRALPVRIHDLDNEDIRLCESITGGFLRGIEFIYKELGVNRPLRSNEDNPHDNLNHTYYRNQINKVALAVKEIIESMRTSGSSSQSGQEEIQIKESKDKKETKIKEPLGRDKIKTKKEIQAEKVKPERIIPAINKPGILIPVILGIVVILGAFIFLLNRHSKIKWSKEEALPEIEQFINKENITAAYSLVQKAGKYISKEPKFQELSSLVTSDLTILTDPTGADVYIREYLDIKGKWKKLGRTPIESAKIPGGSVFWGANSFYLARIEEPGYEDVLAMTSTLPGLFRTVTKDTLYRKLFIQGTIPPDMVYVEGFGEEVISDFYKEKHGFFIDRYEVTNKKFKEFIDYGGYSKPVYWKNEFIKDGKKLTWDEAMAKFKDKTGRPGPAIWVAGDYPDGQDNYPVSGISWYEAAAYAEYAGKSLPTSDHWYSGAGGDFFDQTFYSKLILNSNFKNIGPEPVGKYQGVTRFGAYDMAGNVREWCWNETKVGHIIRGGAWDDASYLFYELSQLPSFDRSEKNGFRCVKYIDKEKIPESVFQRIDYSEETDFSKITPVEDNIFAIYKSRFLYDKTDLNEKVEEKDNSNEDWSIEKITFNATYGKERVIAYLFIPNNSSPPFQTLIFYPGLNAIAEKDLKKSLETKWLTDYLLKSGRAVLCPIYKGTFERIDDQEPVVLGGRQLTDWIIKWVKDFSRSVDYLETRSDIDHDRIGYYGSSWGGLMGGIIPAIEDRLKVNILIVGGLVSTSSDMDIGSFVSRVKIPTLMLNGKYDYTFPYEKSVLPFFNLLGTTKKDLKLYDTDHYVPRNEMIKEVLNWCDNYLGPVKLKSQ